MQVTLSTSEATQNRVVSEFKKMKRNDTLLMPYNHYALDALISHVEKESSAVITIEGLVSKPKTTIEKL